MYNGCTRVSRALLSSTPSCCLVCRAWQLKAAIAAVEEALGPVDVLICNAGMCIPGDDEQ